MCRCDLDLCWHSGGSACSVCFVDSCLSVTLISQKGLIPPWRDCRAWVSRVQSVEGYTLNASRVGSGVYGLTHGRMKYDILVYWYLKY